MDYVTLPLGDEAEQQGPTAPPSNEDIVPGAVPQYQPRPPATAPATAFPSLQDYSQGGGVPQFEITVSEPQKQGNGYQAFICYKVPVRILLYQLLSPPRVSWLIQAATWRPESVQQASLMSRSSPLRRPVG